MHRRSADAVEKAETEAAAELEGIDEAEHPDEAAADGALDPIHRELRKYQRAGLTPPLEYLGWIGERTLWSDEGGVSA